jgi:hypothetical protein
MLSFKSSPLSNPLSNANRPQQTSAANEPTNGQPVGQGHSKTRELAETTPNCFSSNWNKTELYDRWLSKSHVMTSEAQKNGVIVRQPQVHNADDRQNEAINKNITEAMTT